MKLGIGVLVLLAASCAREGGVVIEVTPTSAEVDKIRLFIGTGDPTHDAQLLVPVAKTANAVTTASVVPLTRWGRDKNNESDYALVSANETARFVLVQTDTDYLGSIIAVGYRGTEPIEIATQFGVALPVNQYRLYHLTLEAPAAPPITWGPDLNVPPSEAVCIGYSDPKQTNPALTTAFIVTPGDQDCDGLSTPEDGECNPDAWKGSRPANLDEISCLTVEPSTSTCYLGGPICHDGQDKVKTECLPSPYCAPASVCARALSLDDAKDVTRLGAQVALPTRYECTVHVNNGNLCEDHLILPTFPNGGQQCTGVAIATAGKPFADHMDFANQKGAVFAKLDAAACEVSLAPTGKPPGTASVGGMVVLELNNGRGVAVPVVLTVDTSSPGCGTDVVCTAESTIADQQLMACASAVRPQQVGELSVPTGADDPTLTGDMLDIWFNVNDTEIWHSSRPSVLMTWDPPAVVPALGAPGFHTKDPHVSPDGLTMYFGSDRAGTVGGYDIWTSHRTSRTGTWPTPMNVVELTATGDETGGSIDGSGTTLVFEQTIDGVGNSDIYIARRLAATGLWTNNVIAAAVSTPGNDTNPHITKDGLELWFTTTTPNAGLEIFMSKRTDLNQAFPMARRIFELSSTSNDSDPWVSPDGHTVFFASSRVNGVDQIFMARR